MSPKTIFFFLCLGLTCCMPKLLFSHPMMVTDTCTSNDECDQAFIISGVVSDQPFICVPGCNLYASPEIQNNNCDIAIFPTVWFKVTLDINASVMNLFVNSDEFESPTLSLYRQHTDCGNLEPVGLTSTDIPCIVGSAGEAEALGTPVVGNTTYYLAISSLNSIGGHFEVCINTLSNKSACVLNRNIEIVSRSNSGPLEGPFDPLETVHICMNVNDFTAAGNGCQWFQGLVPVFGNGWDPSSFDSLGQPKLATINGFPMGKANNGLYSTATWDWFDDVDYHHDNPSLTITDLDGNGRLDICNSSYEMDCPYVGGISGGCCGPCWGSPSGEVLPPGWFAYGINGTCPTPGPPIRVDWGDGNTCGGGMGPWQFCFDLVTRDVPDCMLDSTRRDLSLGFFTFADGETGSWVGSSSVCALDHPTKLTLQAKCGRVVSGTVEQLPTLCSGDTLGYKIEEGNVLSWEWNISPFWAVPYLTNSGPNGFTIEAPLVNTTGAPIEVTGILIGRVEDSPDIILKQFKFELDDAITCGAVATEFPEDGLNQNKIRVFPSPVNDRAILEWSFDLQNKATIDIYDVQGKFIKSFTALSHDGQRKQLETESLLPGIYFLRFSNSDFHYVTRFLK